MAYWISKGGENFPGNEAAKAELKKRWPGQKSWGIKADTKSKNQGVNTQEQYAQAPPKKET